MRGLGAGEVLEAWEAGRRRQPFGRAMLLLRAAASRPWEELRALPIGERDRLILELRERTLGPRLVCFAECPRCRGRLEFTMDTGALRSVGAGEENGEARWNGGSATVRRATVGDMEDALRAGEGADAYRRLLERCVQARD